MQKWQYAHIRIGWTGDGEKLIYEPDAFGQAEKVSLPVLAKERNQVLEITLADMGLEGWELAGVSGDYFYFKRPIE